MRRLNVPTWIVGGVGLDRVAFHALVRHVLKLRVIDTTGVSLVELAERARSQPRVCFVLGNQPNAALQGLVKLVRDIWPQCAMLGVAEDRRSVTITSWLNCKVDGLVARDEALSHLQHTVQALLDGDAPQYSPGVAQTIDAMSVDEAGHPSLSKRESQVLTLLARGLRLRETADKLRISYKTADAYRTRLMRKFDARNRVELVRHAIRLELVEP